jgi:hypothetical protein
MDCPVEGSTSSTALASWYCKVRSPGSSWTANSQARIASGICVFNWSYETPTPLLRRRWSFGFAASASQAAADCFASSFLRCCSCRSSRSSRSLFSRSMRSARSFSLRARLSARSRDRWSAKSCVISVRAFPVLGWKPGPSKKSRAPFSPGECQTFGRPVFASKNGCVSGSTGAGGFLEACACCAFQRSTTSGVTGRSSSLVSG